MRPLQVVTLLTWVSGDTSQLQGLLLDLLWRAQLLLLQLLLLGRRLPGFQLPLAAGLGRLRQPPDLSRECCEHLDGPTADLRVLVLLTAKLISAGHLVQGQHVQLLILGDLAHAAIVFLGQGADLPHTGRKDMGLSSQTVISTRPYCQPSAVSHHTSLATKVLDTNNTEPGRQLAECSVVSSPVPNVAELGVGRQL